MKLSALFIGITLAVSSMAASAEYRNFTQFTKTDTLADIYYSHTKCLAIQRESGFESINGVRTTLKASPKVTIYNFQTGDRVTYNTATYEKTTNNDLSDVNYDATRDWITYSTPSTPTVILDEVGGKIEKTWEYIDSKGRYRLGKSINQARSVNCQDFLI